jgi:polar amino acid transport system ATP-binding protein
MTSHTASIATTDQPMGTAPIIDLHDVRKSFGSVVALSGVSLSVHPGEVIAVIGASGGGKSTLLRCINHLERPDSGTVLFHGQPIGTWTADHGRVRHQEKGGIERVRSRMPMVFQRFHLFKNKTVLDNVTEGQLVVLKRSRHEAKERALHALKKVGMADRTSAYPTQLSGGQQQRVAIARALAMDPEVILFDEPTSSLDPERVGEVLEIIQTLAREGMTMVVVTHEMAFARHSADMVYFLNDGAVCEAGPPAQIFNAPRERRTKEFVEAILK